MTKEREQICVSDDTWAEETPLGFDLHRADSNDSNDSINSQSGLLLKDDEKRIPELCAVYNKGLFRAASTFINPGRFFRFIISLYGERKLMVFLVLHFIATMTIWAHFGMVKFEEQKAAVPKGAPFYWWKRIAPSIEFGTMHSILFQLALLPLTMSRYSIAALSETVMNDFVPLNRIVQIHIYLGYFMVITVFFATAFFFAFFGRLCAGGQQEFCDKFTSEIMITGYVIMATLLIIAGTSYFRHCIPYEVFYVVHHLVFAMYLVTIIHTVDSVQRNNERNRSQTFKWFTSTILWYVCDRVAMRLNHRYKTKVISASAVGSNDGSRMLVLRMKRPVLFQFKPGQYAHIKNTSIDQQWHPFSIASDPNSRYLEFYIEVLGQDSWTGRLWTLLEQEQLTEPADNAIEMELMGPFGTSLGKAEMFTHGLAIGTGTGIVPILSMFKQHVSSALRLSPKEYFEACEENRKVQMDYEVARDSQKGSLGMRFTTFWKRQSASLYETRATTKMDLMQSSIRSSIGNLQASRSRSSLDARKVRSAASVATRSIYGVVFLGLLSAFGVLVLALTISWNTIPIEIYDGMRITLKVVTVAFQICFAIPSLFFWDSHDLFSLVDLAMCVIAIPADIIWFGKYAKNGVLDGIDIALFCLLTGYMTGRLWIRTVCHRNCNLNHEGGMKRLEVVWIARSASLISELIPEINALWESMVSKWGLEDTLRVCRFSIYCTDEFHPALDHLSPTILKTSLFQQGFVHFGRPEIDQIIENQTLEVITESRASSTLLAFCGSPQLANLVHRYHVSNSMLAAITGHKKHQMHFVSESYGGKRKTEKEDNSNKALLDAGNIPAPKKEHFGTKIQLVKDQTCDDEIPSH